MLANRFRGLWLAGFSEELVDAVQMITTHCGHWNEAVYAINDLLRFDFKTASVEEISALNTLKNSLLPSALEYRIHLCLCGDFRYSDLFLEEDTESELKQATLATQELGKELASDPNTFASLLPKILEYDSGQLFDLGHGVAMHSPNKATWHVIYETFSLLPEQGKAIRFVQGFLYLLADMKSELANSILDQSLTDIYFSKYFMLIQKESPLDEKAIKRIIDSIHIGKCQTYWYKLLGYGKVHEQLSDNDLYLILSVLSNKNDSTEVMLEILYMRLKKSSPYSSVTQMALRLISQADNNTIRIMDYQIGSIIESCTDLHSPKEHAPEIFDNIISQLKDRLSILDCQYTLEKLAQWWPYGFIKKFVLSDSCSSVPYCAYHDSEYGLWKFLAMIDEEVIHDCCAPDPQVNYLKMAKALNPKVRTEEGDVCWTPLALNMLEQHDSPTELLDIFKITLEPMSWRGSRAEIMEQNLPLFDQLLDHKDKRVRDWATTNKSLFANRVKKEKQSEEKEERVKFERFE
ncbi:hypothetical protein DSM19430T_09360 [Desulfovibrio psychrotolerans]|uniref:Uncharacterized protein n=2 Tax=Desulfovibrio psychrotolerans TaxID=415242 RepID=A0A7J0BSV2_9BACT|nr:hypothetical protein DSM19430T_09360 [Desulfovibrio psychrotolerans]